TLTEYMDLFEDDRYTDVCIALGEGILKQQNPETGSYWHILGGGFIRAEEFRTIYYDGECTFALARLYSLTGEQKWLDAACKAIDHFIDWDYTRYRDHWVAYSLNEVTKYVDRQDYYEFALANATNNYKRIKGRYRTYPTN
ncbi:MAG: glycosyl hydrolase family 88, partial [bacterium]